MNTAHETLAIFGGTFNPPHVGHVLAAHYVLLTRPVDRVLVVPCASHPFGKNLIDFTFRHAMCSLAFAEVAGCEVLDIEAERDGPSYTVDTVHALKAQNPDARFELIIGSDLTDEIPEWHKSEALLRMADLIVLPRLEQNTEQSEREQDSPFYLPRTSSTTVREMLAAGEDCSAHLPRDVVEYIRDNNLYE